MDESRPFLHPHLFNTTASAGRAQQHGVQAGRRAVDERLRDDVLGVGALHHLARQLDDARQLARRLSWPVPWCSKNPRPTEVVINPINCEILSQAATAARYR